MRNLPIILLSLLLLCLLAFSPSTNAKDLKADLLITSQLMSGVCLRNR